MIHANKLLLMSFFIATIIFISVKQSQAAEQILATITTDVSNDRYQLTVETSDDGQILEAFMFDEYPRNGTNKNALPIAQFITEGIKLPQNSKFNFAKISGQNFDHEQGGMIIIDTLYNFITGKRKSYELHLAKDKNGWKLYDKANQISRIIAHANKAPLIGIIGAKELVMK